MSNSYWNPYQPPQNWGQQSNTSDVLLTSQLEQIKSLGRIEEAVRPIPEMRDRIEANTVRITRLEDKLDTHIENCQPRGKSRRLLSIEALKENWTVVLLAVQVAVFAVLQMVGQPDKAQQVWSSSPAFRNGGKEQD